LVHWRGWFASKPTEAEFVEGLIRDRSDAATWVYDPKARTLSQSGNVLNLVNIYREFAAAPKAARKELLAKYRALLSPEKISSLWSYAQTRIYPLMLQKGESTQAVPRPGTFRLKNLQLARLRSVDFGRY
jgi:hypothetical protein